MKTLSLVAYNRPGYLAKTLASLKQIDWTDYKLFVTLEHKSTKEVRTLCENIDWIDKEIQIASKPLGCDRATYWSICTPFNKGSQFNIYLEDDIEVSNGLKQMADWYYGYDDRQYVCLCPESYTDRQSPTNEIRYFKAFNSHGILCNKHQFETHMRNQWLDHKLSKNTSPGWDWNMMNYVTKHSDSHILAPMHAYTHHIGEMGTYCRPKGYRESGQAAVQLCHDIHDEFYIKASE